MFSEWKPALGNRNFKIGLALSLIGVTAFASVLPYFFVQIILNKPGVQLNDPILNFFSPKDWSIEIFIGIYLATVLSLIVNSVKPYTILLGLQVYVIVNFMRLISIYFFTLEAPEGIIPLSDPFLTKFAYGQPVFVKDLFFSGHISTLAILFFIEKRNALKIFIFLSMTFVSVLLAWQRVHYAIDMIAAIFITWIVHAIMDRLNRALIEGYN
jgi:hypothetical protein